MSEFKVGDLVWVNDCQNSVFTTYVGRILDVREMNRDPDDRIEFYLGDDLVSAGSQHVSEPPDRFYVELDEYDGDREEMSRKLQEAWFAIGVRRHRSKGVDVYPQSRLMAVDANGLLYSWSCNSKYKSVCANYPEIANLTKLHPEDALKVLQHRKTQQDTGSTDEPEPTPDEQPAKQFRSFKVDLRNESPEMVGRLKVAAEAFGYLVGDFGGVWLACFDDGSAGTFDRDTASTMEGIAQYTLTEALEYLEGKPAVENNIEAVADFVASQVPVNSASYHDFIGATRVAIAQSLGVPAHVWWDPEKPETEKTMDNDKKEKAPMTITIPTWTATPIKWCVKGVWTVLKDSVGLAVRWTLAAGLIASAGAYAEAKLGAVSYVISLVETLGM